MSKCIRTYTGLHVDPRHVLASQINIEDIAHALSNICRYGGHCREFYSVAQHSVLVASKLPLHLQLAGLLHDASEAYLGDIVAPLKHRKGFGKYREIEYDLQHRIYDAFGVGVERGDVRIHEADVAMRKPEQDALFGDEPCLIDGHLSWVPEAAKRKFTARFTYLKGAYYDCA